MEIHIARQIGQAVRKQRNALGFTQHELAEKAHVDRSLIVRIESGEAKSLYPDKLLSVLHALDLRMTIEPNELHSTTKGERSSLTKDEKTTDHDKAAALDDKREMGIADRTIHEIRGIDGKLLLSTYTKAASK